MRVEVDNSRLRMHDAPSAFIDALIKSTSYLVEGREHVLAFKRGYWDGRHTLVTTIPARRGGGHEAPVGLLADVERVAAETKTAVTYIDRRRKPAHKLDFRWNADWQLREYQLEARDAACADRGLRTAKVLLKLPTRSGKTVIAASIIHKLGARTLFIVTSDLLLKQTVLLFQRIFGVDIGQIGDGEWDVRDITVASIQSLAKNVEPLDQRKKRGIRDLRTRQKGIGAYDQESLLDSALKRFNRPNDLYHVEIEKYKAKDNKWRVEFGKIRLNEARLDAELARVESMEDIRRNTDLLFFDECHHLEGEQWREVVDNIDAPFKIGMSATISLGDVDDETPREDIWIRAVTGPIVYEIQTQTLMDAGFLLRPRVMLVKYHEDRLKSVAYARARERTMESEARNRCIVRYAKWAHNDEGMRVLITIQLVEHANILSKMLVEAGLSVAVVLGNTPSARRKRLIQQYLDRDIDILLGTVFGEGVDIPAIECVINAGGGRSRKATLQRFRNLTPAPGKTRAVFVDLLDVSNKYLAEHALARLTAYRETQGFEIVVLNA